MSKSGIKCSKKYGIRINAPYLFLIFPAFILLLLFNYLPMAGTILAFKDYNYADGIWGSEWAGFKYFEFFFASNDAVRLIRNTLLYRLGFLFGISVFASAVMALMFYEVKNKHLAKVYHTSMLVPYFVSWVVVAYFGLILFNTNYGYLNQFLEFLGMEPVNWYVEPKYWPVILTLFNLWKTVGMGSLYFYSSLMGIDPSLFEAAELDGAGRFKQIIHISIPCLIPVACVTIIMQLGQILQGDFGLFYQLTMDSGSLYPTTDILNTYIFRLGIASTNANSISSAAAVSLFQSVVGLIMVLVSNSIIKKVSPENSMF